MRRSQKEIRQQRSIIYQGKVVDLMVDQVKIPDGTDHVREIVGHRAAVAIIPILDNGRILLIRQYRYAVASHCWELPAGIIEAGEKPRQAAKRECLEETGYRASKLTGLGWFFSSPGFSQERIHLFLATGLSYSGGQQLDQDEFLTVTVMDYQRTLTMIEKGQIRDGKTIIGLLLAKKHL